MNNRWFVVGFVEHTMSAVVADDIVLDLLQVDYLGMLALETAIHQKLLASRAI